MSIEALQQQMAETALRRQDSKQILQQTAGALQQSQKQQAAAATVAGQSAPSMSVLDRRLLGKPVRWNGEDQSWKYWRFVTRAYLTAALPSIHDLLERAENGGASDSVLCAKLTRDEARHSRQLYCVLVLLVTGRALDKVQGAGEGEGAAAWRAMTLWQQSKPSSDVFVNTNRPEHARGTRLRQGWDRRQRH